jgi:hypothetical protein
MNAPAGLAAVRAAVRPKRATAAPLRPSARWMPSGGTTVSALPTALTATRRAGSSTKPAPHSIAGTRRRGLFPHERPHHPHQQPPTVRVLV